VAGAPALLEAISLLGEIALFRGVFPRPGRPTGSQITIVVSMLFFDEPAERFLFLLRRAEVAHGRLERWLRRAAALPRSLQAGLGAAIEMLRRHDPSVLGALVGRSFDIGALWASFQAFGHAPRPPSS
jgi:hypothetical protein